MKQPIEQTICYLIQTYMDLPDNWGTDKNGNQIPCVVIQGQNIQLYSTPNLQITVSTISNNVFATHNEFTTTETGYQETVYSNEKRTMQVDVYSKNLQALLRYNEVQLALSSTLAEELQDQYNFKIATISTAQNVTGLEGGSEINHYIIRFDVLIWHEKTTVIDYYDTFKATYQTNNTDVTNLNPMVNPNGTSNS